MSNVVCGLNKAISYHKIVTMGLISHCVSREKKRLFFRLTGQNQFNTH